MSEQKFLILDFETYSQSDLKKIGAAEYSFHHSTEILCVGWKLAPKEKLKQAKTYSHELTHQYAPVGTPMAILHGALMNPAVKIVAHNAYFEQVILRNVMARKFPEIKKHIVPERFICTAALAASYALPRNLEGACLALKLPVQKDMEGRRLILKWCKPRRPTKHNSSLRHDDPEELERIIQYCATDIDAETELFLKLKPLIPFEQKVWCLDQKINHRGFYVDRPLVRKALALIAQETGRLHEEVHTITAGAVVNGNQRAKLLSYIQEESYNGKMIEDLQAKTVREALEYGDENPEVRRLLEIRRDVSRTSTAKYAAFEMRSREDSRVRDMLVYHAASTGRWGGSGVQPQNFPRGSIKDTALACEILRTGDLELVRLIYENPMEALSSALRGVITATPGKELFCADYNAIEARVLFWVAKHEEGIAAWRDNRDLYCEMASEVYRRVITKKDAAERFFGKTLVLGAGYGLGHKKFLLFCEQNGIKGVDEKLAKSAIEAYRSLHAPVPQLWRNLESAAIAATKNKGKVYTVNRTSWWVEKEFLYCKLPSGRCLAYYGPEIRFKKTPWGEMRPQLYHWCVNSLSKKWECAGTWGGVLTENVVQAISRDLLADAMLRIEGSGYEIILSVHDEIVAERTKGEGSLDKFSEMMSSLPPWALDCPIKVEGWQGERYRK